MITYKVNKSFSTNKYTDAELVVASQGICNGMTNNPYFPSPTPSVSDLQTTITAFLNALSKMTNGTKEDTVNKNTSRKSLEDVLKRMGDYVEATANNNLAALVSSGFPLRKTPEPLGDLPAPTGIVIEAGDVPGSLVISWNPVKGTYLYIIEYTTDATSGTGVWQRITRSKCTIVIPGLTRGGLYVFRIAAAATSSDLNWSNEISSYVM